MLARLPTPPPPHPRAATCCHVAPAGSSSTISWRATPMAHTLPQAHLSRPPPTLPLLALSPCSPSCPPPLTTSSPHCPSHCPTPPAATSPPSAPPPLPRHRLTARAPPHSQWPLQQQGQGQPPRGRCQGRCQGCRPPWRPAQRARAQGAQPAGAACWASTCTPSSRARRSRYSCTVLYSVFIPA